MNPCINCGYHNTETVSADNPCARCNYDGGTDKAPEAESAPIPLPETGSLPAIQQSASTGDVQSVADVQPVTDVQSVADVQPVAEVQPVVQPAAV